MTDPRDAIITRLRSDYAGLVDQGIAQQLEITRLTAEIARLRNERQHALDHADAAIEEIARLTRENEALRAERDAIAAAAFEAAARWHDDVAAHDQSGIDYSDAVGIPISNRANLAESVRKHEYSAQAIRALSASDPDATAALNRFRAGERAALGREVLERLRHEIAIKPTLTYADAIEWVETIFAQADAVERGE